MSMLTRLLLLLTVLALLPFGSFATKFGTSPRAVAVISAQLDDTVVEAAETLKSFATTTQKTSAKTFASTHNRCKGKALPGSSCNPALAVWPTELALAFHAPARALHPTAWPTMIGHNPPRALGPPRLA